MNLHNRATIVTIITRIIGRMQDDCQLSPCTYPLTRYTFTRLQLVRLEELGRIRHSMANATHRVAGRWHVSHVHRASLFLTVNSASFAKRARERGTRFSASLRSGN